MNFIKSNSAQADGREILIGVVVIILVVAILATNWDTISDAISRFLKATCVNDPRWSSNKC
jgi:hypothetical protein